MNYTQDIVLNVTPDSSIPIVRVKQGDASTRFIHATIVKGHEILIPGAELTVLFREEKPDGTGVLLDSTYVDTNLGRMLVVVNEDGSVTIELVEQTTTCPGLCKCDISFIDGQKTISSASFILDVERAPDVATIAVSSDDFRTLINALEDVGLSSTTQLTDMTDVALSDIQNNQILAYSSSQRKWVNKDIADYGFLTEQTGRELIQSYGYQTVTQINTLIAEYIAGLDGNNVEY